MHRGMRKERRAQDELCIAPRCTVGYVCVYDGDDRGEWAGSEKDEGVREST